MRFVLTRLKDGERITNTINHIDDDVVVQNGVRGAAFILRRKTVGERLAHRVGEGATW